MALTINSKTRVTASGADSVVVVDVYDVVSVDDVIAFTAQARAHAQRLNRRRGKTAEPQPPSDALKQFLRQTQD